MDENVLSTIIADDEAEALLRIEEFDDTFAFANDLGRHSATAAASAAKTAAAAASATAESTAATAEAAASTAVTIATATAAEAAAVAITAASASAAVAAAFLETASCEITCETLFAAETFALVAAAPAAVPLAPSIETHAPSELKEPASSLGPMRSGQMAQPVMVRKTTHAPFMPLQEKSGRL
ncbi:MAG: hypothetical protein ACJ8D7_14040 [Xanthobacteraceae bacterium]